MPDDIERFKGLGELEPRDFQKQCINPKNRKLKRIRMSDNPKHDLEIVYKHFSSKKHYEELRAQHFSTQVFDEQDLDT